MTRRRGRRSRPPAIPPLNVLLLGRTAKRRGGGGISRSATMIVEALTGIGDVVRLRNVNELLTDIPQGTDLIWHYGDLRLIDQHIATARDHQIPMVINSSYDNLPDRRRWMMHQLKEWDPEDKEDIFLGVFTGSAAVEPRLAKIDHRLVPIPKTVRSYSGPVLPFGSRDGICLGELEKLGGRRVMGDPELVTTAIKALQETLPGVPLYVFNQYGHTDSIVPSGVTIVPYNDATFLQWLGTLRLYLSLVGHETFSMVPCEAQSAGTPIIYRSMPQSLTEQLGQTGFMFRSLDELVMAARALYLSEARWSQMSQASVQNAKARSTELVGTAIDLALRRILCKGEHK